MDFLKYPYRWIGACVVMGAIGLGGYLLLVPTLDFPNGDIVSIAQGTTAADAARELSDAHVISQPMLFRLVLRLSGESGNVHPGAYLFASPQNILTVASRLANGAYGFPPVRITFTEGTTVRDEATQVAGEFPGISAQDFLDAAQSFEGYLFPDTYFFQPSTDVSSIVAMMRANFDTKIKPELADISTSGHSIGDTVVLASLLEKEARTAENRRIVAGILENRLAKNMPLQVDAVFGYIFKRDTYSPSLADLKVDSPYNTYTHTGLPPGPIGNPGLDAIDAAVHPTQTDYLYYLTDKNGMMHYATTFAEHQANERKYLR